jgi:hypothetical protein
MCLTIEQTSLLLALFEICGWGLLLMFRDGKGGNSDNQWESLIVRLFGNDK